MRFVATSDWHLSTVNPFCRMDEDWVATQQEHLDKIKSENLPVVIAGDVFDTPVVQPAVTNMVLKFISECDCSILAGNHDLPFHSIKRIEQCSFGAIRLTHENKEHMYDFGTEQQSDTTDIVALHKYVSDVGGPGGGPSTTSEMIHSMFPNAKAVIIGDNHIPWAKKIGSQLIVNCGCLIQRTAAEAKHPCGYWIVDTDICEAKYVDCSYLSEGKIDTSYIENIKAREEAKTEYEDLVREIKNNEEVQYDFLAAVKSFIDSNTVKDSVREQLEAIVSYVKGDSDGLSIQGRANH